MFFFNPELLLISEIDALNPGNPAGWVWINNPFEIAVIFCTAFIGMMAFSCFTQGYFIVKTNIVERLIFLVAVPFMFLPKIMESYLGLPDHNISYLIGISIVVGIYFNQKVKQKTQAKIKA